MYVSLDGLHVHDLATMDVDEFKEWLWPGTLSRLWTVLVTPGVYNDVWETLPNRGKEGITSYGLPYPRHEVRVRAKNKQEALDKALVMVDKSLAKARKAPCTML